MPEGDTVYRAAAQLHAALAGDIVERFDLRVPDLATVDLRGERTVEVVSRGKHILHRIGGWTLRSHLRMEGRWHVSNAASPRWPRDAHRIRAVVGGERSLAVGTELAELAVVPTEREDELVGHLGPDLLGQDWDAATAAANLEQAGAQEIAVALADQRRLAGLGNVYVNEVCFLRGLDPHRPAAEVDLPGTVDLASRLIRANRDRSARVTTGNSRPGARLWVYGRAGKPCRRCGTAIRFTRLGADPIRVRDTYWCPRCQR